MALLIKPGREPAEHWTDHIKSELPNLEIRVWPDAGNREEVEYILANELPPGEFGTFPNLKFVACTAVGVERLLNDASLSPEVPILRQSNKERMATMSGWVIHHVLHRHRRFDEYQRHQARKTWKHLPIKAPCEVRVGVMGLGNLGCAVAQNLSNLMYDVAGWTRSRKNIDGIRSYAGAGEFYPFLERSDFLVSILPNTAETQGLLDAGTLARLPEGAYVINAGRGTLIDEDALLAALDSGHLSGAALDVFQTEPLPQDHRFWTHPKVTVTPHYSCLGRAAFGAANIVENIRRVGQGQPLTSVVDKAAGY